LQYAQSVPGYQHAVKTAKSRGIYIVLGLFLGTLGIHNFYAGFNGRGAAQLIITVLTGWLIIGLVATAIWALVEIITTDRDAAGDKMV
jgi:TM2 domain-containing membrane protein YozV